MELKKLINQLIVEQVKNYKIYLDDERFPKSDGWMIVRNFDDFTALIELMGVPKSISFDNDLGEGQPEGYDCAKWMVNEKQFDTRGMEVFVHSANPKAPANIYGLFNNWNKMLDKYGLDYKPDVEFEK